MEKYHQYFFVTLVSVLLLVSACSHREWIEPALPTTASPQNAYKPLDATNAMPNNNENTNTDYGLKGGGIGTIPWKDGGVIQVIEIGVECHRSTIKK